MKKPRAKKPAKRYPPIRLDRFTVEWSDLQWLKPVEPLVEAPAEPEPKPPTPKSSKENRA